jgi:dihydroorotate dehydrogenase
MPSTLVELERLLLNKTFFDVDIYKKFIQPTAFRLCGNDAEKVHSLALYTLNILTPLLEASTSEFDRPILKTKLFGKEIMPFGTAAGLDKDGEALYTLSQMFGFLEPGTLTLLPRTGNPKPRIYADSQERIIYNSMGFPNRGLEHFLANLEQYRESGGESPVIASISAVVPDKRYLNIAYGELEKMVTALNPLVEGYVWNPYSPNTKTLALLRTPRIFGDTSRLLRSVAGEQKALLVKMGPFEKDTEPDWLNLVEAYISNGGDGIVAVNTYPVPREKIPAKSWGYSQGGISGRYLKPYRQKAVSLARREFPSAVIIATGGIDSAEEAWDAFSAGADAIEGYTPYVFSGFGLLTNVLTGLEMRLAKTGYHNLSELCKAVQDNPQYSG